MRKVLTILVLAMLMLSSVLAALPIVKSEEAPTRSPQETGELGPPTSGSEGSASIIGSNIALGVNTFSHIGDWWLWWQLFGGPGYGFGYPVGKWWYNEMLAIGWWGEGFYTGYWRSDGVFNEAWSYESWPGVSNLINVSETSTATHIVQVEKTTDSWLQLTHDFYLPECQKKVILRVDLKNTGPLPIHDIRYKRNVDWDIYVNEFSGFINRWDYWGDKYGLPMMVAWDGSGPDARNGSVGWPPTYYPDIYTSLASSSLTPHTGQDAWGWDDQNIYGTGGTYVPDPNRHWSDDDVSMWWDIPVINPGETKSIYMYYLVADSEAEMVVKYHEAESEIGLWFKNFFTDSNFNPIDKFDTVWTPRDSSEERKKKESAGDPVEFKLASTNPGQFMWNIVINNTLGVTITTLTINYNLDDDFILKGADPIQVHTGYGKTGTRIPATVTYGDTGTITITNIAPSTTLYITLHLEYDPARDYFDKATMLAWKALHEPNDFVKEIITTTEAGTTTITDTTTLPDPLIILALEEE